MQQDRFTIRPNEWTEIYYAVVDHGDGNPEDLIGVEGCKADLARLTTEHLRKFAQAVSAKLRDIRAGEYDLQANEVLQAGSATWCGARLLARTARKLEWEIEARTRAVV
jgi:hypothetical protein